MTRFDRSLPLQFDWILLALTAAIPIGGLIVLYSAGFDPEYVHEVLGWEVLTVRSQIFLKQLVFFCGGLAALGIAMSIPARLWFRFSYVIYFIFLLLLVAVLVYGTVTNGSKRWLSFGVFNLQPSELVKLGVILALGRFLSKFPPRSGLYRLTEILVPTGIFLLPMAFILVQPDLGTALVVGAIGMSMILFIGVRLRVILTGAVGALLSAGAAWIWVLRDYQKRRVLTLFDPAQDPQGSGWQIIQSKIAVGSGELFGKGFLQGSQTQLEFLPERSTDFIFCVLAEEWGFLGSVTLLALYCFLIARMMQIVLRSRDLFSSLVIVGVAAMIFFHAAVNLGMVVGLLPVVGLPLPLFSYGGSSLLTTMFSIGIVMGLAMNRSVFTQGKR